MVVETRTPQQTPPNILLVVAAVFIAVILSIAAFIFGSPSATGPSSTSKPLVEDTGLPQASPDENPVFCTMDAKLCPDGSSVGRVAPSCQFAPCPGN